MRDHRVADRSLAEQGRAQIDWAESRMPVLMALRAMHAANRPLERQRIACCAHATKETAVLIRTLLALGAEVSWTGGNPVTTQDAVSAALVDDGAAVFGWNGMSKADAAWCIAQTIRAADPHPTLVADDGADLICLLHDRFPEIASRVSGGSDKTSSGVRRVRAMAAAGALRFPVLAVNEALTKWEYDNVYGTGQSAIDGILRATGVLLAGKTFVVGGFGHVGRGVALRARGMGARVIVTCIHATTALKAHFQGFRVLPMDEAAPLGDIFCTASGMRDLIVARHLAVMKDGAILCNVGHSDSEINLADLERLTAETHQARAHVREHRLSDGRRLYLLAYGGLVNLAAGEGNASEVMDLSFANQLLALLRLADEAASLEPRVYDLADEQDQRVARLKLETMGVHLDAWTDAQRAYATGYAAGT